MEVYEKDILQEKIETTKKQIINLKKQYVKTYHQIRRIRKERKNNHFIILLSFLLAIIISILLERSIFGSQITWTFLKIMVVLIPNISLITYEMQTKMEKKLVRELEEKLHDLNKNIFTEEFFLEMYLGMLNSQLNEDIDANRLFSKHRGMNLTSNEDIAKKSKILK